VSKRIIELQNAVALDIVKALEKFARSKTRWKAADEVLRLAEELSRVVAAIPLVPLASRESRKQKEALFEQRVLDGPPTNWVLPVAKSATQEARDNKIKLAEAAGWKQVGFLYGARTWFKDGVAVYEDGLPNLDDPNKSNEQG